MDKITQRTVFEVDGEQFDTMEEAQKHVADGEKLALLQTMLYGLSDLSLSDAETAANCVMARWLDIKDIMEGAQTE